MRRVGKQIVAITLAAAMMGSLTPEACTFLQNEIVYAAETNEASAPTVTRTELYKNEDAKTTEPIDFSGLQEEDWNGEGKIRFSQLKFLSPLKTLVFPAFSPPRFGPFPSFFPL